MTRPRIQAVTLDFFRTLAHHRAEGGRGRALMDYFASQGIESRAWEHQVLYDVFEPHAREYSPRLTAPAKRAYLTNLCGRVFERLGVSRDQQDPATHATRVWDLIGPSSLVLYGDVHVTLERLRAAGYPLAVLSNRQCGLGHFCDELGVGSSFDHVVASAEVGRDKPSPGILMEAADRLGVAGEHIVHVGDTVEDDLNGARAAGWHAILIDRDGDHSGSDADIVRSLNEIPPYSSACAEPAKSQHHGMNVQGNLMPGTLDLLILRAVFLGDVDGYGVLLRIEESQARGRRSPSTNVSWSIAVVHSTRIARPRPQARVE